jgi:hypothetical protein
MLGGICSSVAGVLIMSAVIAFMRFSRRDRALRRAGLQRGGAREGEWSASAIAEVLSAFDPAKFAPKAGDRSPYAPAATRIYDMLPLSDAVERDEFAVTIGREIERLPDTQVSERRLKRAAEVLWRVWSAARERWVA